MYFFFQAEDGIRDGTVTGVQTCALPILKVSREEARRDRATIERVLAQLPESALAVDALGMIGSVQRSTELAQALRDLSAKQADLRTLRAHYTDAGPAVRDRKSVV